MRLYDVMIGDATLYQRADQVEAGWTVVEPILDEVAAGHCAVQPYPAGTSGPAAADALLERDGRQWLSLDPR